MKKILFVLTIIFLVIQLIYGYTNTRAQTTVSGIAILEGTGFVDVRNAAWWFVNCLRFKAFNAGVAILMMAIIFNHKIT